MLDRDGEATAAGVDGFAVVFGKTTPDSIGLANLKSVGSALGHDRAAGTYGLGRLLTGSPSGSALAFRVEEDTGILAAAGTEELPVPNVGIRAGKPRNIRHDRSFRVGGETIAIAP